MFIVSFAQPPARARRAFQVSITQRAPFPLPRSSWQPAGRFVGSEERSSLVGRTEGVSSLPAMLVRRLDQKCRPSNVRRTATAAAREEAVATWEPDWLSRTRLQVDSARSGNPHMRNHWWVSLKCAIISSTSSLREHYPAAVDPPSIKCLPRSPVTADEQPVRFRRRRLSMLAPRRPPCQCHPSIPVVLRRSHSPPSRCRSLPTIVIAPAVSRRD